jgi:hypothetical protein
MRSYYKGKCTLDALICFWLLQSGSSIQLV